MKKSTPIRVAAILAICLLLWAGNARARTLRDPEWIHPKATTLSLPLGLSGPFVKLDDDSLLCADAGLSLLSKDDGKTWSKLAKLNDGSKPGTARFGQLVRAKDGTIIFAYHDQDTYKAVWDKKARQYTSDTRQDIWTMRSLDGGKT